MTCCARRALKESNMFDLDLLGGRRAFDDLLEAVLEGGELALQLYRGGAAARVQNKPDRSPVTEADRAVETHLRTFVGKRFKGAQFFGEEAGGDAEPNKHGLRFIVDPIDGTRTFLRGMPTWSILVGLEYAGALIGGVAYMPAAGDFYWAIQGHGAYANGRPVRLSRIAKLSDALVCLGGLSQFTDDGRGHLLEAIARESYTQRAPGDFAGYAALLAGQADAVIDPGVKPYDIAAAYAIVREAGGTLTALNGADTIEGPGAIASNGALHDELVAFISRHNP
jgi:histidinol-phosphatase